MLATIATKTIRDRWIGVAVGSGAIALLLVGGMAIYRDIDLAIYTDLPEALRSLIGIGKDTDVGGLAYGAIYASYGVLVVAGLAVSMGSGSFAREERAGTMALLLGNPKSRTYVLVSKAAAMVALTACAMLVLYLAGIAAPELLNVDISGLHIGALATHMFVHALFYGFMAAAIGAWTGKAGMASGLTAGFMVISFVAVGLLPLVNGLENVVNLLPWHYFSGADPLLNGVNWGDLAVLLAGVVAFAVVSLVGVNRRDLRVGNGEGTVVDRLRANPLTQKVMERLAGSARVSRIWVKTASEHQGLVIIVAYVLLMLGISMGPMYTAIDDALRNFGADLPEAILAMVGGGDLSTPEGWYQIEVFGLMVPAGVMVVTITIGARALAGEEANRTMGLLLANPITRSWIVLEKTVAMVLLGLVVGASTFIGVVIGSAVAGLGIAVGNIAAASLLATLLGTVFGSVALALSAATGRVRPSIFGAVGAVAVLHITSSLLSVNENVAGLARWLPNHYYLSSDPLTNGLNWSHAAVLAALSLILVPLAVVVFDHRDLRSRS